MNPQDLYKQKVPGKKKPLRVSAGKSILCAPFIYALNNNKQIELTADSPAETALKTREQLTDVAFISAIEFGRVKEGWQVFDGMSQNWQRSSRTVALFFQSNLHSLQKIAVIPGYYSERALLSIVLRERYELRPEIVEKQGSLEQLLGEYDAVLMHGEAALAETQSNKNYIDLAEQWYEMTGLPFVNGFWVGRNTRVTEKEAVLLQESLDEGRKHVEEIAASCAANKSLKPVYRDFLESEISYVLGDLEKEALVEFYRYAFYFSLIEYIPEFKFL